MSGIACTNSTEVIDLSFDSSPEQEPLSDLEIAYKEQIAEFSKFRPTSEINIPTQPESKNVIVLYSPDTKSSPSIDTLLISDYHKIEQENQLNIKKQERSDAELAEALQRIQEMEEKTKPVPQRGTCTNALLKASEIAKLYASDDITIPNIHELFVHFDKSYFEGSLSYVVVKWSYHMKVCAGLCEWKSRGNMYEVEIKLSEPLLKFRSRTDLIDTLLHEMIHAYLLIKHRRADREEHGPMFKEQMNRVNRIAGTKITIYHSFFDEVNYYKQHWWKCSSCQQTVKRTMNRAPNKNDKWFPAHAARCSGTFEKIKEPDDYKSKNISRTNKAKVKQLPSNQPDIKKFFPGLGKRVGLPGRDSYPTKKPFS